LSRYVRTFEDYARVDFAIGDNDPVYFAVARARKEWGYDWAARFCVGMLAYYDMGVAARAADIEGSAFWGHLKHIYPTASRGNMRRHFRGNGGVLTLQSMIDFSPRPEDFFKRLPSVYTDLIKLANRDLYGFGNMFVLKIADYMDRCLGHTVVGMHHLHKFLPTQPAKAVKLLYPTDTVDYGFKALCFRINQLGLLAPPYYDRPVGPAEVETALCDWKTAKYGTNWLGSDIIAKRYTLKGYGDKAAAMSEWLPPNVPQDLFILELE